MNILIFNFLWMTFNIILAILAVIFGWLFYTAERKLLAVAYLVIWILLLPNTVYLFTDLINLINQWGFASAFEKGVFIFQYTFLQLFGFFTFILALYPFEKRMQRELPKNKVKLVEIIVVAVNLLVGFGIVLGRIERVNSWDVFANPQIVISSSINILKSFELFMLFVLFSLFSNFFYFLFKKPVIRITQIILTQVGFLK